MQLAYHRHDKSELGSQQYVYRHRKSCAHLAQPGVPMEVVLVGKDTWTSHETTTHGHAQFIQCTQLTKPAKPN